MEYFPAPLEKLVEQFARLPGIGGKSAQRLAFYVLGLPEEEALECHYRREKARHLLPCVPEFHRRGPVPHLFLAQAGRERDLRGGGPPGCGGAGAVPGV